MKVIAAIIGLFIGAWLLRAAHAPSAPERPRHPCLVAAQARAAFAERARDASLAEALRLAKRIEALDAECEAR